MLSFFKKSSSSFASFKPNRIAQNDSTVQSKKMKFIPKTPNDGDGLPHVIDLKKIIQNLYMFEGNLLLD